jgi:hypothetical protein
VTKERVVRLTRRRIKTKKNRVTRFSDPPVGETRLIS